MQCVLKTNRSELWTGKAHLPEKVTQHVLKHLKHLPRHHTLMIYGRPCHPKRNTQFYSDVASYYGYSSNRARAKPLGDLKLLLEFVNDHFETKFNGILVNQYVDGNDSIGRHSDDEEQLGDDGVLALAFGQPRKFRVRYKETNQRAQDVLSPASASEFSWLWMKGDFQQEFTHEIPVEKRVTRSRISLTFRHFIVK